MNARRVKAFTIMEVTVTMMIASILMGITYTTYSIISKSYLSFNRKNSDMAALEQLDKLLKRDFERAEIIQKETGGITIKNAEHTVTYEFNPDFIVRTAGIVDTFKIKTEEITTSFEGLPVNEVGSSEEQNRLDELGINLLYQNEKIPYYYHKQYSSVNLIQRNPNALN
jgi:prepilin-type N-terminal cleavage/methylation domain-containing protein